MNQRRPKRDVIEVTIPKDAFLAFCLERSGRTGVPVDAVHGYTISLGVEADVIHR